MPNRSDLCPEKIAGQDCRQELLPRDLRIASRAARNAWNRLRQFVTDGVEPVLREYDLGHNGCDYVLRTLGDGRALSTALAQAVERRWKRTYTLLPGGIEDVEAHEFDEPLRQIDYPVNRSDKFLLAVKDYSAIDALASHFSEFMVAQSHAFLWIEDYLARPGDPILTTRSTGSMTVVYLNSTVVYSVSGKALLASGQSNRTPRLTRSMPVLEWSFPTCT